MKVKNLHLITLYFIGTVIITGCMNQKSVEEKIYDVLEKGVGIEKGYDNQQTELVELENKEKELYEQIIATKDPAQRSKIADEALLVIEKRRKHLREEQKSIEQSEKEFEKLIPLIDKINDAKLEQKANKLTQVMGERYEEHRKLVNFYLEGLDLDAKLYEMLNGTTTANEELANQIVLINQTYEEVQEANNNFNELTDQYNEVKNSFYNVAGLNVTVKKSS